MKQFMQVKHGNGGKNIGRFGYRGERYSKIERRSLTGQIEHWARIGKYAQENPDLTNSLKGDFDRG